MSLSGDGYEYGVPSTLGGGAATYTYTSPWGPTPFEYCVRVVSASGAGGVAITYDGTQPAVSDTTVTNLQQGQQGELYNLHAAGNFTPAALFAQCPTSTLTITITGSSKILLTIHPRRRLQFAYSPPAYHINPDVTPESVIHQQRAIDAEKAPNR